MKKIRKVLGGLLASLAWLKTIFDEKFRPLEYLSEQVNVLPYIWQGESSISLNMLASTLIIIMCVSCLTAVKRLMDIISLPENKGPAKVKWKYTPEMIRHDALVILYMLFALTLIGFFQFYDQDSQGYLILLQELVSVLGGIFLFAAYLLLHLAPISQQLSKRQIKSRLFIPIAAIILIYLGLGCTSIFSGTQITTIDIILKVFAGIVNFLAMLLLFNKYLSIGEPHYKSFSPWESFKWYISMILFGLYSFAQLTYGIFDLFPKLYSEDLHSFILMICFIGKIGFVLSTQLLISKGIIYQYFVDSKELNELAS